MSSLEPRTENLIQIFDVVGRPPTHVRNILHITPENVTNTLAVDLEEHLLCELDDVCVRIVRPHGTRHVLPVVIYFHGGWMLDFQDRHDHLMRGIATSANAAVVFVKDSFGPDTKDTTGIKQAFTVLRWLFEQAQALDLDCSRIAVVGDGVGGHLSITLALQSAQAGGPRILFQILLYPITESDFALESYREFADGPWLTQSEMEWVWDQYQTNPSVRTQSTLSPWHAMPQDLCGLPSTLILTDENVSMRDEGEAYAIKLLEAGVDVTLIHAQGTARDLVTLNANAEPSAARAAMDQAMCSLRLALGTTPVKNSSIE